MKHVLIVEDHQKIRANLMMMLKKQTDLTMVGCASAEEAGDHLAHHEPDLMLLDIRLPGKSGLDLIQELGDALPPTIVISGEATISETVEALRLGVYDFIEKPISRERLLRSVRNCLEHQQLKTKLAALEADLAAAPTIIGDSKAMTFLVQQCAKVAPTDGRVMIRGESGTGKELVASYLHQHSKRAGGPFVKINCAAIPANLIEDELFGHVRGAFTDARTDKAGLFETAHNGTLFLDEIGDMDLSLQARLLRVLEDGTVRRLGDTRERRVDVRVVCATHHDLEAAVAQKTFRQDLYFRLNTVPLEIPALRKRGDDIRLLFFWFLNHYSRRHKLAVKQVDASLLHKLDHYAWPGNVRELRNLAERLVILGCDPITPDDLPGAFHQQPKPSAATLPAEGETFEIIPLRAFRNDSEKHYITAVLKACAWNFSQAAKKLAIQRTYLYQKTQTLGIEKPN
ncbi:sigma-54-dependent transcriptional regulator [Acanthopleuribacter pedis]|uniref:Sigma-54-dependent Fis family transcriptional regulator n=1 Tax=Acanthopleuribacter pedis TaxID=442870 RepID=A0A8J7QC32_9BACT|nr:sigma-54 dependent transcriptional regulator [Acanthopleuribacter pedis]MBO1322906.1 sigma-54-dependent Fis family transcriptional regulator [Acanthopleuribacter pedis]